MARYDRTLAIVVLLYAWSFLYFYHCSMSMDAMCMDDSEEKRMLKPRPKPLQSPATPFENENAVKRLTPGKKLEPRIYTKHALTPKQLKRIVGTPIIVVGMMKAGTTSIFGYFKCGLRKFDYGLLSHYDCNPPKVLKMDDVKARMSCGRRMRTNIIRRVEPFTGMDRFLLYAEIDSQDGSSGMILPQYDFLEKIHSQFPTATFILNLRDSKKWIKSIDKWKDLRQRFIDNHIPPILPRGVGANDTDLEKFYLSQAQRVRDFVADHPTHELVEVAIDSPNASQIMQDHFGITKECWGVRNQNHDGNAKWQMNLP